MARPHDPAAAMHDDEVAVDVDTVRRLVADQFPEWAHLSVRRVATAGTVNAIFRIGAELGARFPLRLIDPDAARAWLAQEARAQAEFARVSPFPTPAPERIGRPGDGYPMPFTVQSWVAGRAPGVGECVDSVGLADDLARLIHTLRAAPTGGRVFRGSGRGGSIPDHDDWMQTCIALNAPWFDPAGSEALWAHLRAVPRSGPDVMMHGDLVPGNVLIEHGRLVGVLDAGGFGPADPALDLVAAWHLLDRHRRARLRCALQSSELEWERGRAWAFVQAMGLVHYYANTNPQMHRLGIRTLQELLSPDAA